MLRDIQSSNSKWIRQSLNNTLEREIQEETGLSSNHYSYSQSTTLKPFSKVEGAKSNHALTHYEIQLFDPSLEKTGFLKLLDQLTESQPDQYIWFNVAEILAGKTVDGKQAFIDALHDHFDSSEQLKKYLEDIPESYQEQYQIDSMIELPYSGDCPIIYGSNYKPKPLKIQLKTRQKELLLTLGWHLKTGNPGTWKPLRPAESVYLLPHGWIKINDSNLINELMELTLFFNQNDFPLIEAQDQQYFLLSVLPQHLFFEADLFTYQIIQPDFQEWSLVLHVEEQETPFGKIEQNNQSFPVSEKIIQLLKVLEGEEEEPQDGILGDIPGTLRQQIDKYTQPLGLRKLVNESGGKGNFEIVCLKYFNDSGQDE